MNIQIFAESGSKPPPHDVLGKCPFGSQGSIVELVDQGFQFRHKCLVHRTRQGSWTVYMCVLCQIHTHAVDHEAKIVAVGPKMEKGALAISHLKGHEDFSSVFQLLLGQSDAREKSQDAQGQSYETLQKQIIELQSVLGDYLKKEEEAMENRIKKYEDEQRATFAKLAEKGQKEKAKLVSLLFNNSESSRNHVTPAEKNPAQAHAPLFYSKSSDPNLDKRNSRHSSSSMSDYRKSRDSRDLSPDDVFAMDELEQELDEENENSLPETRSATNLNNRLRNEQDRNNSNNPHQHSRSRSRGKDGPGGDNMHEHQQNRIQMSTSVPISMPMTSRNLRNSSNVDSDIDEELAEFDDIPRCMQALSESIQERDRYIFGDRPRQRVNTGDFTQLNWR